MGITVNVEDFSTGPATSLHKMQLIVAALKELQAEVSWIEQALNGGVGTLSVVLNVDGVDFNATITGTLDSLLE